MKMVALPSGTKVPALGQGTWNMGDDYARRAEEIATLRLGIELGMTLIDTAEMYGDGRSEQLIAEAISGCRDEIFLVSKVLPNNATRRGTLAACERSLKRLNTDRIDLYLLHWRGGVPFAETIEVLQTLQRVGKIRYYGVSNLDFADMREWWETTGGDGVGANQLLYNLSRRGIEWDLLPWLRERRVPVMAYSPFEQAGLMRNPGFVACAQRAGITPGQMALAWLLQRDGVIAIPKSARREHVKENAAACDITLSVAQLDELDQLYAPPSGARALEFL
jgi:diketogulonate reductase-like aldo/keto reductase